MPQPVTPEYFQQTTGVDATTAAQLAAEHNAAAGIRPGAEPPQPHTSAAPATRPSAPASPGGLSPDQARAELESIITRRMNGEITDYAWRTTFEKRALELGGVAGTLDKYRSGSGVDRSVLLAELEAGAPGDPERAITESIDSMEPPRAPYEYVMPQHDGSPDSIETDSRLRQAMFEASVPRELGGRIAQTVNGTAAELYEASPEQAEAIVQRNEKLLRDRWGAQFGPKLDLVRSFLRREGERSPIVREWFENHPELFSSPDTMTCLLQCAEREQRQANRRTR